MKKNATGSSRQTLHREGITALMESPRHRAPRQPPPLTKRGRIVRDMTAGAAILGAAIAAQPISVAFFTAVVWAGQVTGLSA